jgi:transcriptional/translational regulatory protein YebC/TACO1
MIDTLTDNKNRTLAELKRVFNKAGGTLASAGSVAWQFEQKGVITLKPGSIDFDELFMVAAEAGAEDVVNEDGTIIVYTPREMLNAVETALTDAGYAVDEAQLKWESKNETEVPLDKALINMRLMSDLEELDDVQSVASNLLITDDVITAFE